MSGAARDVEFGIHQVVATAVSGDAITNLALELRDVLRRVGPSDVFARHIAPNLMNDVRLLSEYQTPRSRGLLVYHASIGEPIVSAFLMSRPEPLVLVYHNISPARYFKDLDDTFAELLELGRLELSAFRPRVNLAIAVSHFNAAELEEIGYRDVRVIAPVVDPFRLARVEPDAGMLSHLDRHFAAPIVLFVGQLLPHKRPDLLVKALHVATTYLGAHLFLVLAGHSRFAAYTGAISAQIRELNLGQALLVGSLDDAALAAMFTRARAFVTFSEHEGYCVPLIEAMTFGVPIVARACAAIPETVGTGGLLLPKWSDAEIGAEAIVRVLQDDALHDDLAERGRRRLDEITAVDPRVEFLDAIAGVL